MIQNASTRMTGGYFSKASEIPPGDPSKPMSQCYLFNNRDVLRYILFSQWLSNTDRGRCAQVCRTMRATLKSKEEYFRWQFLARYHIIRGHFLSRNEEEFIARMKKFIDDPQTDYSKFKQPKPFSVVKNIAALVFGNSQKEHNDLDTILEEAQRNIEITYAEPRFSNMNEEFIKVLIEDKNNEYELQAYHDALYPLAAIIAHKCKTEYHCFPGHSMGMGSSTQLSLPAFNVIAEALFRLSKKECLVIAGMIRQASSPDDLKSLNHSLPHAKHLEMLTFSRKGMDWSSEGKPLCDFSWTNGSGFAALKEGLIRAPKLRILHFDHMQNHLIDEKNALAIADIVICRQKMKGVKPFEEIRFGAHTITEKAAWLLLEALKDYPVPIVVYLCTTGNFAQQNDTPYPVEDIKKLGRMVNFRWDQWVPDYLKVEMASCLNEDGYMMRAHISEVKRVEAKRNMSK